MNSEPAESVVDTTLRQCQLVQLRLLHAFVKVCDEEKLCYFLEGGTLLGAMRHDGFIPWDDDIDVGMPRVDYEKFLKIAPKHLPKDVQLVTPRDVPNAAIPYAKLRDTNSFYGESRPDYSTADPSGIFIDIFPYDDVPNVWGRLYLTRFCASSWKRMHYFYNKITCNPFTAIFYISLGEAFRALYCLLRSLVWVLNKCFDSNQVTPCLQDGYFYTYANEFLFPQGTHKFEDGEFSVPNNPDGILTTTYGDWRQIPPPDKRPRHARIIDPVHAL